MLRSSTKQVELDGLWTDLQPTSRRLLLAALDSFAARGYHATTTREVAQRAGMSPAAVYVHYRSKGDLLFEIGRAGHEMVLAEVEGALRDIDDPVEAMRGFVASFTSWHARHHTLARIIQYELHNLPPDHFATVRKLRRRTEVLIRGVISDGVDSGAFDVDDVEVAALAVLSLGIDVARWYGPRRLSPEKLGTRYVEVALRIVGVSAPR